MECVLLCFGCIIWIPCLWPRNQNTKDHHTTAIILFAIVPKRHTDIWTLRVNYPCPTEWFVSPVKMLLKMTLRCQLKFSFPPAKCLGQCLDVTHLCTSQLLIGCQQASSWLNESVLRKFCTKIFVRRFMRRFYTEFARACTSRLSHRYWFKIELLRILKKSSTRSFGDLQLE